MPLDLEAEYREIEEALRPLSTSGAARVVVRVASQAADLIAELGRGEPAIMHFVGHGEMTGIPLRHRSGGTRLLTVDQLTSFFRRRQVRLVVLNCCYSATYAMSIAEAGPTVIGTNLRVEDEATIAFSRMFYRSLSEGRSIADAFEQAQELVRLEEHEGTFCLFGDGNVVPFPTDGASDPASTRASGIDRRFVRSVGAGLALLVTGLTLLIGLSVRNATMQPAPIVVDGESVNVVSAERIDQLTINAGDSADVRQQKLTQRHLLISSFLTDTVRTIDTRLFILDEGIRPSLSDGDELRSINESGAPAAAGELNRALDGLLHQSQVRSLRRELDGVRLPDLTDDLALSLVADTDVEPSDFLDFLGLVSEVGVATERIYDELAPPSGESCHPTRAEEQTVAQIELALDHLANQSALAYDVAQRLFTDLLEQRSTIEAQLAGLQRLSPDHIVTAAELEQRLADDLATYEANVIRRADLVGQGQALLDDDLDCLESLLDDGLALAETDPPRLIVGKAISLRQLGRHDEAVAAFRELVARYGENEPWTVPYAETAVAFTDRAAGGGQPDFGLYVFEIDPESPAFGHLTIGDIITAVNDQPVGTPDEYLDVIGEGAVHRVDFLRLDDQGWSERSLSPPPAPGLLLGVMGV